MAAGIQADQRAAAGTQADDRVTAGVLVDQHAAVGFQADQHMGGVGEKLSLERLDEFVRQHVTSATSSPEFLEPASHEILPQVVLCELTSPVCHRYGSRLFVADPDPDLVKHLSADSNPCS